jgi:hypothetical protein
MAGADKKRGARESEAQSNCHTVYAEAGPGARKKAGKGNALFFPGAANRNGCFLRRAEGINPAALFVL